MIKNLNQGISVLIISLENEKVETEKNYFYQKKYLSLRNDKEFLNEKLNIKNLFFVAFNISASKNKIKSKLSKLLSVKPYISKVFFICDRDYKSFTDNQIERQVKKSAKIIYQMGLEFNDSYYLKYDNIGDNFETFLKMHSSKLLLPKNYQKNDQKIYEKTMGYNGKNYEKLIRNIKVKNKCQRFSLLFKEHQQLPLEESEENTKNKLPTLDGKILNRNPKNKISEQ